MAYIRLEVRCCCKPQKLMGWLCVAEDQIRVRKISVPGRNPYPEIRFCETAVSNTDPSSNPSVRNIGLPIQEININGHRYLAIKGEATPIDTLERIPGFERNPEYID